MNISGKNFVGYTVSAQNTASFFTFDSINNQANATPHFNTTAEEVEQAVQKAHAAFPIYATLNANVRATFLTRIAQLLTEKSERLILQFQVESGLSEQRGTTELNRTIHQLHLFAQLIQQENFHLIAEENALPQRLPTPKPAFQKITFPLGPVVVFGASNFPFAYSTIGGDAASALAAGCPVIIKSHPMHAGTSELVAQLVLQAAEELQLPDGVFSHLNANNNAIGEQLVKHPYVKAVGFTGSIKGGMALVQYAQERKEPIPVFCEMGSLNPVFIFPDGMEKYPSLVEQLCASITNDSGQFCTKPGLIFIPQSISEPLIERFIGTFTTKSSQPMLHPSICKNYHAILQEITEITSVRRIQIPQQQANFGTPQLSICSLDVFQQHRVLQEEVFGPHAVLIVCPEEAWESLPTMLSGNLTASVWTTQSTWEQQQLFAFNVYLKAGRIIFNGVSTGVEVTKAMHHGGPFPATNDSRFSAVGDDAILRFLRPISLQNYTSV